MSNLRFLPASGDNYTHIALLSGHSCCIHAVSPIDGERGTVIPLRFHKEAIGRGCSVVGIDDHQEAEPAGASKQGLIIEAIEKILERNDPALLNADGRPSLDAVKKEAGFGVTRTELDDAFDAFADGLSD